MRLTIAMLIALSACTKDKEADRRHHGAEVDGVVMLAGILVAAGALLSVWGVVREVARLRIEARDGAQAAPRRFLGELHVVAAVFTGVGVALLSAWWSGAIVFVVHAGLLIALWRRMSG